jgi:RNA polymerase sigma-70 factor, ECF subfamily
MDVAAGRLMPTDAAMSVSADEFSRFVESEQRRVFLLCYRMLRDRDEADSAAQDAFLKAYKAINRPGPPIEEPSKWITRIAVNTCLDLLRSRKWQFWRKRPAEADERLILESAPESAPDAERVQFSRQVRARLQEALGRLSARQRAVFSLRHDQGLSLEEIGQMLGLDVGTVKAHMSRAIAKLRQELKELHDLRSAPDFGARR